jgi:Rrf2 family protein
VRITRQVRYAIYGVFDLAYNGQRSPVRVQEIGQRQGVPTRYLEQIFQRLRRAGLVESKRGPGGGYVLARTPSEISIADVLGALEGAVLEPAEIPSSSELRPEFVWTLLGRRVTEVLSSTTLGDLCREAAQRGLPRADAEPAMYQI